MRRLVSEQKLGFVATVCPDGTPNLSPKGTTAVWDDSHLVFLHLCSPGTVANLASNPNVEINVVDPFARKGYRFKGQARVLSEGELFERILGFYRARGTDTTSARAVVLMRVETASRLISPVYDTGASEPEVVANWRAHHLNIHPARCVRGPAPEGKL